MAEDDLRPLNFGLGTASCVLWMDRHGVNSWRRPRLRDMLWTERGRGKDGESRGVYLLVGLVVIILGVIVVMSSPM